MLIINTTETEQASSMPYQKTLETGPSMEHVGVGIKAATSPGRGSTSKRLAALVIATVAVMFGVALKNQSNVDCGYDF